MKRLFAVLVLCLAPLCALAQSSGAGFATQSIFLSQANVFEGDTVRIYASVFNTSDASFSGFISFKDGSDGISEVSLSLSAGQAQVVSIPWKPIAGSHTVTAEMHRSDGTLVGQTSSKFIVAPPRPKTPSANDAPPPVESSAGIQQSIAGVSPAVANAANPVFSAIDSARVSAANFLDRQIASTAPKLPGKSAAVSSQPSAATSSANGGIIGPTVWGIIWTVYFYLLSILRFIIGSIAFFYPLLALVFFYLMYKLYRRMTRRSQWDG